MPGGGSRDAALVIQTAFLGDIVLTTPLIAHLARAGPVDVITHPAGADLLANNPHIRRVLVYDKRGRDRGAAGFARMVRAIRAGGYGTAHHAQGSLRSAALSRAGGIPRRVGFETSAGRSLYTERVPFDEDAHHVTRLLRLAGEPPAAPPPPSLCPGETERTTVDALLAPAAPGEALIALAPGSVWATKRWPYYAELAGLVAGVARPVVVGSAADRDLASALAGATQGRAIDATGRLSLLGSAELIRRCRVLVTNDSAPLHLASAMNTPTVAIFGPTVPAFGFGPLADRSAVLGMSALVCRPCDRHGPMRCPLGHWRCMLEVTAASAFDAVRGAIG